MPLDYSTALGPLDRVKNNLALTARRRIFDVFMRECRPSPQDRVADFGVSGHREHPVHYFFEALYPYKNKITAIGQASEDAHWFPDEFPGLVFLEADLRHIPVADNYFDAGICSAVVEHAGNRDAQRKLVAEVCRVARRVLFTTPNKQFPVELHTFMPLLHWLPDPTWRTVLRRLGHASFASAENLNPLDSRALLSLFPPSRKTRLVNGGPSILQSNLLVVSQVGG